MKKRVKVVLSLLLSALILFALTSQALAAQKISNPETRGGIDGITTDPDVGIHNSYGWCSEMFKQDDSDYLWVGMNRDLGATVFSTISSDTSLLSMVGLPAPSEDTSAKIYRQRASDTEAQWEFVYENPAISGYRKMIVYKEDLYVLAGMTNRSVADYSIVLRFSKDFRSGDTPEIVFWDYLPPNINEYFRSAAVMNGKLYIGTFDSKIYVTDGTGLKNLTPDMDSNLTGWTFVADLRENGGPAIASVWDMMAFKGSLYAFLTGVPVNGVGGWGFSVFKITPDGDGYTFSQIVGDGDAPYPYGLGISKNATASPFLSTSFDQDYIYVSTFCNGPAYLVFYGSGLVQETIENLWCPAQIYRFDAEDNWEVVVGDTVGEFVAVDRYGAPVPFVGNQRAGFFLQNSEMNTSSNQYIWWMAEYEGKLYATTWDVGVFAQYYWLASMLALDRITDGAVSVLIKYLPGIISQFDAILTGYKAINVQMMLDELKAYLKSVNDILFESGDIGTQEIVDGCIEIIRKYCPMELDSLRGFRNTLLALVSEMKALDLDAGQVIIDVLAYVSATVLFYNDTSNPPGFDLYVSNDGEAFEPVTVNGFGDPNNYGGRVIVPSDHGLYLTTANPFNGGQVWRISPVELGIYPNGPREAFLEKGSMTNMTVLVTDAGAANGLLKMTYESDLVEAKLVKRASSQTITEISWDNKIITNPFVNSRYYSVTETESEFRYDMYDISITPLRAGQEELTLSFALDGISSSWTISIDVDLDKEIPIIDKIALGLKLTAANLLKETDYTPTSWASFVKARSAAASVYDDKNALQAQVDYHLASLTAAIGALVPAQGTVVDKTALLAQLVIAYKLKEADYTPASWSGFALALNAAQSAYDDANVSQALVDKALADLKSASAALVKQTATAISVTNVSNGNGQSNVDFAIRSANGKGYTVYLSTYPDKGFAPYDDVNFNSKGAHVRGLSNGVTYYAYVEYSADGIYETSDIVALNPGK